MLQDSNWTIFNTMNLTIDEIMMFAPGGAGRAKKHTQTDNMFAIFAKQQQ